MDEGRDRRRAFHGVGQPDVERDLGRLADGPEEQQQRYGRRGRPAYGSWPAGQSPVAWPSTSGAQDGRVVERAEVAEHQEHGDQEPEVADPVGDERLLGRDGGDISLEPEADQAVGAEAHTFPAEEVEQEIVRQDEHEHGEEEQVEVEEEPVEARVAVHVADRVQVDHGGDAGDEQRHGDRQRVDQQGRVDVQAGDREPGEDVQVGDPVGWTAGRAW